MSEEIKELYMTMLCYGYYRPLEKTWAIDYWMWRLDLVTKRGCSFQKIMWGID